MITRTTTITAVVLVAGLFGWGVPLIRLFNAFQPLIVAFSIMIAAILVRLNRGMPTLEWKSLDQEEREILTSKILDLAKEYASIVGIDTVALVAFVALSVVGKEDVQNLSPYWTQRAIAAAVGGIGTLSVARMAYVIWRDIDIVELQKKVIDSSASRDSRDGQGKLAADKVTNIRSSGIRKVDVAAPKAWGE